MNCTNCGNPSATKYCPTCEPIRERLEKLRADQAERRRRPGPYKKARKQLGASFFDQCKRHGKQLVLQRAEELPVSGQDAALPVGDR